jgi:hypothetical protein
VKKKNENERAHFFLNKKITSERLQSNFQNMWRYVKHEKVSKLAWAKKNNNICVFVISVFRCDFQLYNLKGKNKNQLLFFLREIFEFIMNVMTCEGWDAYKIYQKIDRIKFREII